MGRFFFVLFILFLSLIGSPAKAGELIQWHTENVQLLRGHDFELGEEQRTLITLEHAHGWLYGDTFAFIDIIFPDGPNTTYYGEISPRLSLSKMTGHDFSYGIIKDVLISTTLEKPEHQGPRYLYGAAVDLNVPGFAFFNVNGYIRDDTQLDGDTWQVTLAWKRPFEVAGMHWVTEGFADFAGGEGPTKDNNQLIVPRLLLDIGHLAGCEKGHIWAGMEYSYWHNKFGIDGVTESVPQAQLKWVF